MAPDNHRGGQAAVCRVALQPAAPSGSAPGSGDWCRFQLAFALPQQHACGPPDGGTGQDPMPLDQLRAVLDELADAGVLDRRRRAGIE
jgi:hypothetical protein